MFVDKIPGLSLMDVHLFCLFLKWFTFDLEKNAFALLDKLQAAGYSKFQSYWNIIPLLL